MTDLEFHLCPDDFDVYLRAKGAGERTRETYVRVVRGFDGFLGSRRLDAGTIDDVRNYQLGRAGAGLSGSSLRVSYYALRTFYHGLGGHKDWDFSVVPLPAIRRCEPDVPTPDEVVAIINGASSLRQRAAFMTVYGCGLRTSELLALQPAHIRASEGVIKVVMGKGRKDRSTKLPAKVLDVLRACWRQYRPRSFVFEGRIPGQPINASALQRGFRQACRQAGVTKRLTLYSLRHAFATHLLEDGENLVAIQALLGHQSLSTTRRYTHLSAGWLAKVRSPIDKVEL